MALDHYIPQVHLRNFYSPTLGNLMYAIRKGDLKFFTPDAKSVCRIEDGSTNFYLREDRAIEEFLTGIEPKYNGAAAKLESDSIDQECIYVIAGFVAYVFTCSPGGMRILSQPLRHAVEHACRALDAEGRLPIPPPELGGEGLASLLDSGEVRVAVDSKYTQAMAIASILDYTIAFGNSRWEVLVNPFDDSPFFTSDFPVAIERPDHAGVANKVVPLAPNLAVRICPDISLESNRGDFSFSKFRHTVPKLSRSQIVNINRLIVRCAETKVFFRDDQEWVPRFVKKNAGFRIEPRTARTPHGSGLLSSFRLEVAETRGNSRGARFCLAQPNRPCRGS